MIINSIKKDQTAKKYYKEKIILPIPIKFSASTNVLNKLQRSYIYSKSLIVPTIFKNNYSRHCVNKLIFDKSEDSLEFTEKTRINLCMLIIDYKEDESSEDYNKEIGTMIVDQYKKRTEEIYNGLTQVRNIYCLDSIR